MARLHRFWFQFKKIERPTPLNIGCGLTAYDYDDALRVLLEQVFVSDPLPIIEMCIPDVDVSSLDERHVLPNMGSVLPRGVWFPLGYV